MAILQLIDPEARDMAMGLAVGCALYCAVHPDAQCLTMGGRLTPIGIELGALISYYRRHCSDE